MPRIRPNRSSTSDQANLVIDQEISTLSISTNEVAIGSSIIISWDIKGPCLENDWIGLFYSDDDNTDNSIACFHRYKDVYRKGKYSWLVREFDNEFSKATSQCCFRYYNSTSQILRAVSPVFTVYNPNVEIPFNLQEEILPCYRNRKFVFALSDICVNGLKRRLFSKPSTNVVVAVMPRCLLHHKSNSSFKRSTSVQSKTTEPCWNGEIFRFQARVFDVLQLEVRDSENLYRSKFVGKIGIPFIEIFKANLTKSEMSNYTCRLCDKSGSKYVNGWISFVLTQIPVDGSGLTISLSMSGLSNVSAETNGQINISRNREGRSFQKILLNEDWFHRLSDNVEDDIQSQNGTEVEVIHNLDEMEDDTRSPQSIRQHDNAAILGNHTHNENGHSSRHGHNDCEPELAVEDSLAAGHIINSSGEDESSNVIINDTRENFEIELAQTSNLTHESNGLSHDSYNLTCIERTEGIINIYRASVEINGQASNSDLTETDLEASAEVQTTKVHQDLTTTGACYTPAANVTLDDANHVHSPNNDVIDSNYDNHYPIERSQVNSINEHNQNHIDLPTMNVNPDTVINTSNQTHSSYESTSANSTNTSETCHQSDLLEPLNDNKITSTDEINRNRHDKVGTSINSTEHEFRVNTDHHDVNNTPPSTNSNRQWIDIDIEANNVCDSTQLLSQDNSNEPGLTFESTIARMDSHSSSLQDCQRRGEPFISNAINNEVTAMVHDENSNHSHVIQYEYHNHQISNENIDAQNIIPTSDCSQELGEADLRSDYGVTATNPDTVAISSHPIDNSQLMEGNMLYNSEIIPSENQNFSVVDQSLLNSQLTVTNDNNTQDDEHSRQLESVMIPISSQQISEMQHLSNDYHDDQPLRTENTVIVNPNSELQQYNEDITPELNFNNNEILPITADEVCNSSEGNLMANVSVLHGNSDEIEVDNHLFVNESPTNLVVEQNHSILEPSNSLIVLDESTTTNRSEPIGVNNFDLADTTSREIIPESSADYSESSMAYLYRPYVESAERATEVSSANLLQSIPYVTASASGNNWYEASSDTQATATLTDRYNNGDVENSNDTDMGNGSYASALRAASSMLYQNSVPVTNDWQDQSNLVDSNSAASVDTSNSRWEKRTDMYGREFYYNRETHTTEWAAPLPESSSEQTLIQRRRRLDERYVSLRRAIKFSRVNPVHNQVSDNSSNDKNIPQVEDAAVASLATEPQQNSSLAQSQEGSSTVESNSTETLPQNAESTTVRRHSAFNSLATNSSTDGIEPKRDDSHAQAFLTRHDLIELIEDHAEANTLYSREKPLRQAIQKIRRGATQFDKYKKSRRMVTFLNCFVDTSEPLPEHMIVTQQENGNALFYNTRANSVSIIDPRLGIQYPPSPGDSNTESGQRRPNRNTRPIRRISEASRLRSGNQNSSRVRELAMAPIAVEDIDGEDDHDRHHQHDRDTSYGAQVAAFLSRPGIFDILKSKYPDISYKQRLRTAVETIRREGKSAVEKFTNNSDLVVMLSLFESEITSVWLANNRSPTVQRRKVKKETAADEVKSYREKMLALYRRLGSQAYGKGPERLRLKIRRNRLLEDAFNQIMFESTKCLQKNKLEIQFVGEDGLDYGGLTREFFFLLSRELFNPVCGLFEYSANDTYTIQVSPKSTYVDHWQDWFRFCGRVIGMAIVHRYLLDVFFARPFYKALLERPCNIGDLEFVDEQYHRSITWIMDNEITDDLAVPFCISYDVFGEKREYELKPNGRNIYVTESDKKEYVELFLKWRLEQSISEQIKPILKGFRDIIGPEMLSTFDANELELLICGTHDIDVDDWIKNTEYRSGYSEDHQVIVWFWDAVRIMSNEKRLRLLQFITGTSSLPVEGFAALRGSSGLRKFCIDKLSSTDKLPRAHTCFNRLDLPAYPSYKVLYKKLVLAIEETDNFGIE